MVDDNIEGAETLADLLELWGHDVQVHHDGPSALSSVEQFRPDAVLLDIGLPGMDGYEVARRLRSSPPGEEERGTRHEARLLLIAMTGYDPDATRRWAEAGFDAYLVKPLQPERLRTLLGSEVGPA